MKQIFKLAGMAALAACATAFVSSCEKQDAVDSQAVEVSPAAQTVDFAEVTKSVDPSENTQVAFQSIAQSIIEQFGESEQVQQVINFLKGAVIDPQAYKFGTKDNIMVDFSFSKEQGDLAISSDLQITYQPNAVKLLDKEGYYIFLTFDPSFVDFNSSNFQTVTVFKPSHVTSVEVGKEELVTTENEEGSETVLSTTVYSTNVIKYDSSDSYTVTTTYYAQNSEEVVALIISNINLKTFNYEASVWYDNSGDASENYSDFMFKYDSEFAAVVYAIASSKKYETYDEAQKVAEEFNKDFTSTDEKSSAVIAGKTLVASYVTIFKQSSFESKEGYNVVLYWGHELVSADSIMTYVNEYLIKDAE